MDVLAQPRGDRGRDKARVMRISLVLRGRRRTMGSETQYQRIVYVESEMFNAVM